MVACKKDSKSKTDLLTSGAWVQVNSEVGSGGVFTTDPNWSSMAACEKDNQLIFRGDGTVEVNEGASKCDPTDPQIVDTDTWQFLENEAKIKVGTLTSTIEELSSSTLRSTYTVTVGSSTYTYRTTLSHP